MNKLESFELPELKLKLLDLPEPIIDIVGEIDDDMFFYVRNAIEYLRGLGSPPVTVHITSGGGDVISGLDIYDLLRLYPNEVTTVVVSRAASMGALILQAASPGKRLCTEHSYVLIHHIWNNRISLDQLRSESEMKKFRDNLEKSQARLYKILREKTGQSLPKIKITCKKDQYLDSEESLDFGLVDEII